MSLILVFEPDPAGRERIESALVAEGWTVEFEDRSSERAPDLVVVSSEHPGAVEVVGRFHRAGGGPGVLLLEADGSSDELEVEGRLETPFTDQQIRSAVRRCLAKVQREAAQEAAREAASSGEQLTSADLFGDMLAEVEDEVSGRSATTPAEPKPETRPEARSSEAKRRSTASGDLDEEIERTLSGVLGTDAPRRKSKASRAASKSRSDDDLDELLNQTLSGLGVTGRRSGQKSASRPPAPTPERPPESAAEVQEEAAPVSSGTEPVAPSRPEPDRSSSRKPDETVESRDAEEPTEPVEPHEAEDPLATQRMEAIRPERLESPPAAEPASATDGETFGQYTMLERVAVGGMAEVWKARMKGMEGFQKTVAIKRILPHLTDSSDFVTMFIDEAKLAAQLNHPHIIHIYDLGKIENDYYIAMEYVEGKDLRSILNESRDEQKPLPLGLALLVAARLASGLDHAHRKRDFEDRELGLVHRDVSPQNVLISYEGDIKLCDFGIVKAVAKASKTQMGALKGKLQYMSPEQAWGRVVDARSDVFSLGAVLFEMLTGSRLFAGDSELSVLEAVRDCRVRSPREVNRDVPEEVEEIVVRALRKDPDDRYQTAGELQKDLDEVLYGLKPTPGQGDLAAWVRDLFSVEGEASSDDEAPGSDRAPSVADEDEEEVRAIPALAEIETEEAGSRRGLWVGLAAAAILAAVVVGWFVFAGGAGSDRPSPDSRPAAVDAGATVPAVIPDAPEPEAEVGEEAVTGPQENETASAPDADPDSVVAPGEDPDLQAMIDAQVQERDEELRRRFEEEKRRLEEEIAETRDQEEPEPPVSEPEVDRAEALEASPSPADPPQPAPASSEESADVETTSEPASPSTDGAAASEQPGEIAEEAVSLESEAAPEPGAEIAAEETPVPSPARDQPRQPVEPSEPAPPEVVPGQLVDPGTPGLAPPRLVSIDRPEYPPIARRMKVQGTVILSVLVDENGNVEETRVIQGVSRNVGLNEAALKAAETARFRPGTLEGVQVKTWFTLRIPFQL